MLTPYFTAIFLALLYFSTGDSQPGPYPEPKPCPYPDPQPYPQYIVFPQYNPTSGSIFSKDPSVVIYTNTVIQNMYNSPILRKVFDFRPTTAKQYSDFVYKFILDLLKKNGFDDEASLAEFSVQAITPNFYELTFPLMARFKANLAANFLLVEGVLTIDNAESLALKYVKTVEKYARAHLTSDPMSKFKISTTSFVDFIQSVDDNASAMTPLLVYYYGNEWYVAAVNYRWYNYF